MCKNNGGLGCSMCRLIVLLIVCLSVYFILFVKFKQYQVQLLPKPYSMKLQFLRYYNQNFPREITASYESTNTTLLTLFTTWKSKQEKVLVNENTIKNWLMLKPFVTLVLFTDEDNLRNNVRKRGWHSLPIPRNIHDVPVLKDMFLVAKETFNSHFYGYANGDILFTDSLLYTLHVIKNSVRDSTKPVLVIGRRTNVQSVTATEAGNWSILRTISISRGKLFEPNAQDYFITTLNYPWKDIPDLIVGKRAYDNWLVLNNRQHKYRTTEATNTLLAVHQTTKSGNYESHKTPFIEFNVRLLARLYRKINYFAGLTGCAEEYTNLKNNDVVLEERKAPKGC